MVGLLVLGLAGLVFYLYVASPSRMAKLSGDLLAAMAGTDVHIDAASFDFNGTITLHGLEMRIQGVDGREGRVFDAQRVLITHNLLNLLRGRFTPKTLTFINPTLHLTELEDTGRFNFQLLGEGRPGGDHDAGLPARLPEIFIRNGQARFGEIKNDRFRELGSVGLGGNFTAAPRETGVYFFTLRRLRTSIETSESPVLSGRLDLRKLVMSAKIERFSLQTPQPELLPRQLRGLWEQLEPVGELPSIRFGYDPDPAVGLHADVELQGVALTVPYGEIDSRMTNVSGRFKIMNDSITVSDLAGQVEDLRYVIDGQVYGFDRDAPFKMSVRTAPFAIPEKPRYLLALPTAVQKQFERFTPSGTFQARVMVERKEPGGRLNYDGTVQVSDAKIVYHQFPYPLEQVEGELRFNDERIELLGLRGRGPTDADVVVHGWIAPPKKGAAVHVVITAQNAPVDQLLYDAIPPDQRPILDLFFNRQEHQRLIEQGLIQSSELLSQRLEQLKNLRDQREQLDRDTPPATQEAITELDDQIAHLRSETEIPVFDLGGLATVVAQSSRPIGDNKKFRTTIGLRASGMNALYKYWPYPLRCRSGQLLIRPGEVLAEDLELEGLSGALGRIDGVIHWPEDGGDPVPDLSLTILNLACDPLLLGSIAPPQDQWLRKLNLEGTLDGTGKIFLSDSGLIDFKIEAEMSAGRVQPFGGRYAIDRLTGSLALGRAGLTIQSITGVHGSSQWGLSGQALWGEEDSSLAFDLTVAGLEIEESVLDLLPPDGPATDQVRQLYETHKPEAVVDVDLNYTAKPDRENYRADLRMNELAINLKGERVTLSGIQGGLSVASDGVILDGWGGSFGTGEFSVWGHIALGEHVLYNLKFDAWSSHFGPVTRAMLPADALSAIDGLELDGAYEMRGAELYYRPDDEHPQLRFDGRARLEGGSATVGVPMTQIDGDLIIEVDQDTGQARPHLDIRFLAKRLLAAERVISPLSLRVETSPQLDRLLVRDLWGRCYGGMLLGWGQIELDDPQRYRMDLVLQNVSLNPFIYSQNDRASQENTQDTPSSEGAPPSEPQVLYTGVLGANLAIEGSANQPDRRRGRGEMEIRQANLYEVPLAMALMQILNMTLPSSRSFDRASAEFLLDDDLVLFDSVRFEAPTIEIVGSGLMHYSTLELDLSMVTRDPAGPAFGMLSDLLQVFKDELLSIHVTGTLDEPKPEATSFQGIKQSWEDIFGKPDRDDRRLLQGIKGGAR